VLKVLTIFSAFFRPLTFLVGVYGMNFKFMPELNWEYGYYLTWGAMLGISLSIFIWFKRREII
jgi:magnesium transporter